MIVQPDTSASDGQAGQIIKAMQQLLAARFRLKITRKQFIGRWSKLRKALRLTRQYQDLIDRTKARTGDICEGDGCRRRGCHLHHIERVAMRPDLALSDANVRWLCEGCHLRIHKKR